MMVGNYDFLILSRKLHIIPRPLCLSKSISAEFCSIQFFIHLYITNTTPLPFCWKRMMWILLTSSHTYLTWFDIMLLLLGLLLRSWWFDGGRREQVGQKAGCFQEGRGFEFRFHIPFVQFKILNMSGRIEEWMNV